MYVYASERATELRKIWHFHILKLLFPSIFLLVLHLPCLRNIFNFRCQITSAYIYNQCSFRLLLMVWCYIIDSIPTNRHTQTLSKCMCMRASGASELRTFWLFYILKLLFLSIFCRYTSDTLSVQMTCLSAYMYRQISKCTDKFSNVQTKLRKSIIGGWGAVAPSPPPPPPSGYANGWVL